MGRFRKRACENERAQRAHAGDRGGDPCALLDSAQCRASIELRARWKSLCESAFARRESRVSVLRHAGLKFEILGL